MNQFSNMVNHLEQMTQQRYQNQPVPASVRMLLEEVKLGMKLLEKSLPVGSEESRKDNVVVFNPFKKIEGRREAI